MLILRNKYYSSPPLIMDEDEYLEKMFATFGKPLKEAERYALKKLAYKTARKNGTSKEMLKGLKVSPTGEVYYDYSLVDPRKRVIHNLRESIEDFNKATRKFNRGLDYVGKF